MSRLFAALGRPFGEARRTDTDRVDWRDFARKVPAAVRLWRLDAARKYWWLLLFLGPALFLGGVWMQFFVDSPAARAFELALSGVGVVLSYLALLGVAPNVAYLQREERRSGPQR